MVMSEEEYDKSDELIVAVEPLFQDLELLL